MATRLLSKIQRNQIADASVRRRLALADFDWRTHTDRTGDVSSLLVHIPTGAWFRFGVTSINLYSAWWPEPELAEATELNRDWKGQFASASRWLTIVAKEHSSPDLWAIAREQRSLMDPTDLAGDNSTFSAGERAEIRQRLKEIGRYLVESNHLAADAAGRVERKVEYLQAAVDRLGRLDFKQIVASTVISMVVEAGLTSTAAQAFLVYVTSLLGPALLGRLLGS